MRWRNVMLLLASAALGGCATVQSEGAGGYYASTRGYYAPSRAAAPVYSPALYGSYQPLPGYYPSPFYYGPSSGFSVYYGRPFGGWRGRRR